MRSNTSFGFFISKTVAIIKENIPSGEILMKRLKIKYLLYQKFTVKF